MLQINIQANGTRDSDYDFYVVVKDGGRNIADITADAYRAIRGVRTRAVDIVVGTEKRFEDRKDKNSLEREVYRKGVLLYGK